MKQCSVIHSFGYSAVKELSGAIANMATLGTRKVIYNDYEAGCLLATGMAAVFMQCRTTVAKVKKGVYRMFLDNEQYDIFRSALLPFAELYDVLSHNPAWLDRSSMSETTFREISYDINLLSLTEMWKRSDYKNQTRQVNTTVVDMVSLKQFVYGALSVVPSWVSKSPTNIRNTYLRTYGRLLKEHANELNKK